MYVAPRIHTRLRNKVCRIGTRRGISQVLHDPEKIRNLALVAHIGPWSTFAYILKADIVRKTLEKRL